MSKRSPGRKWSRSCGMRKRKVKLSEDEDGARVTLSAGAGRTEGTRAEFSGTDNKVQ